MTQGDGVESPAGHRRVEVQTVLVLLDDGGVCRCQRRRSFEQDLRDWYPIPGVSYFENPVRVVVPKARVGENRSPDPAGRGLPISGNRRQELLVVPTLDHPIPAQLTGPAGIGEPCSRRETRGITNLAPCCATLDADVLLAVHGIPVPPRDRRVVCVAEPW